jgi:hypothetical protein
VIALVNNFDSYCPLPQCLTEYALWEDDDKKNRQNMWGSMMHKPATDQNHRWL